MKKTGSLVSCFPLFLTLMGPVFIIAFSIGQCSKSGTSGEDAKKISAVSRDTALVMVYNVENLFDLVKNGSEYSSYIPGTHNWNHETYSIKLKNIASVITASNADIVALCEIENLNVCLALQKKLSYMKSRYRYYVVGDKSKKSSTCQAILSRFPVVNSSTLQIRQWNNFNFKGILEADVAIGSHSLKIFVVHWPSKRHPESYRISAAQTLLKRLKQLPASTDYIVVGDLNSNYNEAETFFTEKLDDTNGRTAINHLLHTAKSPPRSPLVYITEADLKREGGSHVHYNLWLELPERRRYSYRYKGRYNTLDNMLVSPSLYDREGVSYVDNSFSVFTWDGRLLFNGLPFRWQMVYKKGGRQHIGEGYSDHLPIMAKFTPQPFTFTDSTLPNEHIVDSFIVTDSSQGFELGKEGWLPYSDDIRLFRDTINPFTGNYSLRVEGKSDKINGAAFIRFPINRKTSETIHMYRNISFYFRGSGKVAFRIRGDAGKWFCYTGPDFSRVIKNTRYISIVSLTWREITLTIPRELKNEDIYEFEIRSAKGEVLCVWLDNFSCR